MHPVRVKGRKLAAANTKWKVYLDHLIDNRGNEVADYLVLESWDSRPYHETGVAVLPILDGKFVLLRSYRHPLGADLWEVPRGFIDHGETPAQAASRELSEESGLVCAVDNLIPLGTYAPEPATMAARGVLFAAPNCTGIPSAAIDEIGLGRLETFDREAMTELISTGQLEEAGTLIAYYRYCAWVGRTSGC